VKGALRRASQVLVCAGAAIVLLGLALVINTLLAVHPALPPIAPPPGDFVDAALVARHLGEAIRFKTVSHENPAEDDPAELDGLHRFLERSYPKMHAALEHEVVNGHALLYTWLGRDASLAPVLFAAHQDVVPVEPGTEGRWTHPPFDGAVAEGFVWGRGAMDDKGSLVCLFEAAEALAAERFRPKRTVYFAFGSDEEVGGRNGAKGIAQTLSDRGVRLEYVLDEGGAVTEGVVPYVKPPVALIGTAEKGFVTVELLVEMPTGHSARPPPQTAVGVLAAAIDRLEHHPMPARLTQTSRRMVAAIAGQMPFLQRLLATNLWLIKPLLALAPWSLEPTINAVLRTTTAPTVVGGGVKENVLPSQAHALINFRILPGDTIDGVLAHVREVVADERVHVRRLERIVSEASPESPQSSPGYRLLERTIRQSFPGAIPATYTVTGATDGRYYVGLAQGVYRFAPFIMRNDDLTRVHGTDERTSVEGLGTAVRAYKQLLRGGE
jgi:carboxypeptidase PM20D1